MLAEPAVEAVSGTKTQDEDGRGVSERDKRPGIDHGDYAQKQREVIVDTLPGDGRSSRDAENPEHTTFETLTLAGEV